uniref:NAD(P)H-quinone oxidoreductase subunit 5, chloroplastic n=1 Tax=Cymbomonas tetramitiformis TaxID=36881 RepID=A0A166QJN0_9CHLO|nr:subunit 5 of NADH-plastoquinone oxidoreductase [Cymbomonas tetramitiformis]ANA56943.1 subunit 5 of NADH-plastoquinone oxidoreductase [Cymbomonas tetramitiformis]
MVDILYNYAWLIPLFPLLSSFIIGISLISFRKAAQSLRRDYALLSIGSMVFSTILSVLILISQSEASSIPYKLVMEWIVNKEFTIELGYFIDPLSSAMLVVVSTVATLVMIYTDAYMSYDKGYVRFFAYLSLFTSSMLALVLSPNLVQVYIFWELIGVCSYLLIGFWYTRSTAADACQKAFITNRVGDFGLMLGILGFYWLTQSFEFNTISSKLETLIDSNIITDNTAIGYSPITTLSVSFLATIFAIFVFLGPIAKSAQFPLHVWLPDAMEGPTPISALIHAATLVAAGIFLVARMFPIFNQLPFVMDFIAWTGCITAFLGATIAVTQTDLKKGLAYSTVSQLGYMMMALGTGAYSAGIFHLITHAYSKALLFLGSGSVIHGMEPAAGFDPLQNQNMNFMGGLRKKMPITGTTFLIGTLSICGVPPFACFWSKDEILSHLFEANPIIWAVALFTAGLTSFYMFRIYFLTFEGESRDRFDLSKVKESSTNMVLPLVILTLPTIAIGWLGTPFNNIFEGFIDRSAEIEEVDLNEFFIMAGSSIGVCLIGFTIAFLLYYKKSLSIEKDSSILNYLFNLSQNKWYIDDFYQNFFVKGNRQLVKTVLFFDQYFIDGIVNFSGLITFFTGEGLRYSETGRLQFYGVTMLFTIISFFVLLN